MSVTRTQSHLVPATSVTSPGVGVWTCCVTSPVGVVEFEDGSAVLACASCWSTVPSRRRHALPGHLADVLHAGREITFNVIILPQSSGEIPVLLASGVIGEVASWHREFYLAQNIADENEWEGRVAVVAVNESYLP